MPGLQGVFRKSVSLLRNEAEALEGKTVLNHSPAVRADRPARPVAQAEVAIERTQGWACTIQGRAP